MPDFPKETADARYLRQRAMYADVPDLDRKAMAKRPPAWKIDPAAEARDREIARLELAGIPHGLGEPAHVLPELAEHRATLQAAADTAQSESERRAAAMEKLEQAARNKDWAAFDKPAAPQPNELPAWATRQAVDPREQLAARYAELSARRKTGGVAERHETQAEMRELERKLGFVGG